MKFIKVRKKPVEVEAFQLTEKKWDELYDKHRNNPQKFNGRSWQVCRIGMDKNMSMMTLEGQMTAKIGDWIIKGVNGEIYPCKDDIFKKTYEIV